MTETVRYSLICAEDLAIGVGTREVRLADGGLYTLSEINVGRLLSVERVQVSAALFAGQGALLLPGVLHAGRRLWGVTVKNLVALGTSNGLTGYLVGDTSISDRWSRTPFPVTVPFQSSDGDFSDPGLLIYAAATDLILAAQGGLFDAIGQIEVALHYSRLLHPG